MKDIGLRMQLRPVAPGAFGDEWSSGKTMARSNDEVSKDGSEPSAVHGIHDSSIASAPAGPNTLCHHGFDPGIRIVSGSGARRCQVWQQDGRPCSGPAVIASAQMRSSFEGATTLAQGCRIGAGSGRRP